MSIADDIERLAAFALRRGVEKEVFEAANRVEVWLATNAPKDL